MKIFFWFFTYEIQIVLRSLFVFLYLFPIKSAIWLIQNKDVASTDNNLKV